jgi:hypothetical protein
MPRASVLALSAALALLAAPAAQANEAEFMKRFSGSWIGTGQFLFGAEPRLEFACELKGDPSESQLTFGMSGQCRMGAMSAPVHAQIRYNSDTRRYYGEFMDGADGNGVDLIGTRAGEGFSLKLVRGPAQGRLSAETVGKNQMKVIIYYRDPNSQTETPVVAMGFTRKEVITGSIQGN